MHRRPVHLWFVLSLILAALPAGSEIPIQERVGDGEGADLEVLPRPGVTLTGTVTRGDGKAVGAARVVAEQRFPGRTLSTATDAGRYRFTGLKPGSYTLTAGVKTGGESESKTVEAEAGTYTVDLTLKPGFEVSGRVADTAGLPVDGAVLALTPSGGPRSAFRSLYMGNAQVSSTAEGTFVLRDVTPGQYLLSARKQGYATATAPEPVVVDSAGLTGITVEMARGAAIRGQVLGLELDELADLTLQARLYHDNLRFQDQSRAQVDDGGRYAVLNLAPGTWTLNVTAGSRQLSQQVEIAEGDDEVVVDLEFQSGFTLQGTVVHSTPERREAPLSGASIEVMNNTNQVLINSVTDSQGRFRFEKVPAGRYDLRLYCEDAHYNEKIEVVSDEELRIDVATAWISGFVRDAVEGIPVEGVHLQFEAVTLDVRPRRASFPKFMMSDLQGRFQARPLPEGKWRVRTRMEGYAAAEATVDVSVTAPVEGLLLEIMPTEGISLHVTLEDGTLPPYLLLLVLDPSSGRSVAFEELAPPVDGPLRVTTVPDGTWGLRLWFEGYVAPGVTVTSPGNAGPIVLRRAGSIQVRVQDLAEDSGNASLVLTSPQGRPYPSHLGPGFGVPTGAWPMDGGQAIIPSLSPGLWSFTITHEDGRTWSGQTIVVAGEVAAVRLP